MKPSGESPTRDGKSGGAVERRVCGARIELHPACEDALRFIPGDLPPAEPGDLHVDLRCSLEAHHAGAHYSLARDLPLNHPAEVWACWSDSRQPSGVLALADCCVTDPAAPDEVCLLFTQHPGAHSWALSDPEDDALRAQLGLL